MADNKQIVFTFRNGSTREFTGRSLLLTFSVPQFFFHLTTAYYAKKDFLGVPAQIPEN